MALQAGGDTADEMRLDDELLLAFFETLDAGAESRAALQQLLHLCEGAVLFRSAVDVLRDEMKARMWGIVCPTCDAIAAPKWTRQDARPHAGYMQCTHTRPQGDMSVTHASWSALDKRIIVVERPAYDVSERERVGGRFASLEPKS